MAHYSLFVQRDFNFQFSISQNISHKETRYDFSGLPGFDTNHFGTFPIKKFRNVQKSFYAKNFNTKYITTTLWSLSQQTRSCFSYDYSMTLELK